MYGLIDYVLDLGMFDSKMSADATINCTSD